MKKIDNFSNCLNILKNADFDFANDNDIYRMGIIVQFNLTFERAWKALRAVLRIHGAGSSETNSPREVLQLGFKHGFVNDSMVWLLMLKKHNILTHIYNENITDEILILIRNSFIPALIILEEILRYKLNDIENECI